MRDHTVSRTASFFIFTAVVYVIITLVTKWLNLRTLSSFMFSTDSDMLWQIMAVGATIAIALQVNAGAKNRQIALQDASPDDVTEVGRIRMHQLTRYAPTLIAVGVTFPTLDYLFSFVMRPERQLAQWPAWEISSALCFTVAISAVCMDAQGSIMHDPSGGGESTGSPRRASLEE